MSRTGMVRTVEDSLEDLGEADNKAECRRIQEEVPHVATAVRRDICLRSAPNLV